MSLLPLFYALQQKFFNGTLRLLLTSIEPTSVAAAALFPSGWRLAERIGQPGHFDSGFSLPLHGEEVVTDTL